MGDIEISFVETAILYAAEQPFYDIGDVEEEKEHLLLLLKVYVLMVDDVWGYPAFVATPYHTEEAHRPTLGIEGKFDNLHTKLTQNHRYYCLTQ